MDRREQVERPRGEQQVVSGRDGRETPATRPGRVRALQRLAGNRAVAGLIAVQRHLGPTTLEDVGMRPTGGGGGGGGGQAAGQQPATAEGGGTDQATSPAGEAPVTPDGGGTTTTTESDLDYAAIARRIQRAVEGLGTDEEAVFEALSEVGSNAARMQSLREAYIDLTGRTLDADLADDLGGIELAVAQALTGGTREERVRAQMRRTMQGLWALTVIDGRGVTVDWEYTGTGSFHRGGNIYLNYRKPAIKAAGTMVHEAQHAETYKDGRSPDATEVDRDTFVTRMIADEAEASTKSMESAIGLISQGVDTSDTGQAQWMVDRFKAAYDAEVERLTEAGEDEATIPKKARDAVRDGLVTNWFKDGTYRTSTSGSQALTYEQHYQAEWDRLNNVSADD